MTPGIWTLDAADIARPGPSPWWTCLRCGWRFRRLRFVLWEGEACPVCAKNDEDEGRDDS